MTSWTAVPPPPTVAGAAPAAGLLEPVLRWLAACQGAWPPHRPERPAAVLLRAPTDGSLQTGASRADDVVDRGGDLLVAQGAGDQAEGLLVAAALLDLEPVRAVGTADRAEWMRLTVAVRDGLRDVRRHRADPEALLEKAGAGAVAELTGLLAQAATRRTPVLLDGSPLVAAAALCAGRLAPGSPAWWLAGSAPPAPAARAAHQQLGLVAVLDLGLGGPEGADIALSVLEQALQLVDP